MYRNGRTQENQIIENKQQSETSTVDDKAEIANQIALGVLNLSQQLTAKILSSSSNNFEVMSPISIGSALQLVLLGAKGNTFNELKNT